MRMVVVLPAPFGPRSPYTEPRAMRRSSPSTARVPLKDFESPEISMAGARVIRKL
jgi:hypothetical protein